MLVLNVSAIWTETVLPAYTWVKIATIPNDVKPSTAIRSVCALSSGGGAILDYTFCKVETDGGVYIWTKVGYGTVDLRAYGGAMLVWHI